MMLIHVYTLMLQIRRSQQLQKMINVTVGNFPKRMSDFYKSDDIGSFPFNKVSEIPRAQFNGTVHSGGTDSTQATACLVIERKERYWEQQFCQMKRDISVRPTEMTRPIKVDHLQSWPRIFRSDQTKMVRTIWCTYQPKFTEFRKGTFLWDDLDQD